MHEPTPDLLADVLGSVLQDSAFIFAEPVDEPEPFAAEVFAAELAFDSVRGGVLRLVTTPRGCVEIAANMLGLDASEAEAQDQARSALAEVLNVVGGAFVTRFFGTKVPSQLGLPATQVLDRLTEKPHTCATVLRLESGDQVMLELDLEPAAKALA
ncbi:MAG: chemotaxis protein CheX [Anaeromyxobacter sp.]